MWLSGVLVYFLIAVMAHAVLCRAHVPGNSVTKFLGIGILSGVMLSVQAVYFYGYTVWALSPIFFYALICEVYIFLFTFVGTSVSSSLLFALRRHALSLDEMEKTHPSRQMVRQRVEKLEEEGLIESKNSRLTATNKGRQILRFFHKAQSFFGHDSGLQAPRSSKTRLQS